MMRQSAFRTKPWLLSASLFLTLATVAMLAYALHHWKTTRDALTAINNRVVGLRQEQSHLNHAILVSQRDLRQQRLQMIISQQEATKQSSTDPSASNNIGNTDADSPAATSRRPEQYPEQAISKAIGFLETALRKLRNRRKAGEAIAQLQQARDQLQEHAGFDSDIESLDNEIEKLYLLQQLENRLPDALLQSLTHELQWLNLRHSAAIYEYRQETSYAATPAMTARRLLRQHLQEARLALRNRDEAQFHAAVRGLRENYTRHFQQQPDFSDKLLQLQRTTISPAALDPRAGISRLLQRLEKISDDHSEVENPPPLGLNFSTKSADASSRTVRPSDSSRFESMTNP